MIWNPWKRIRDLECEVTGLELALEHEQRLVDLVERAAWHRAEDHYNKRTAMLEASHNQLLERMADLTNLNTGPVFVIKETWE